MTTTPKAPIRWRDRQPAGVQDLKDQARRLRELLASTAAPVSSAQALEMMARVHGYDSWGQLNAQLRSAHAAEPTAPSGTFLEGHVVGISKVEAGLRLRHHAELTDMPGKRALDMMHLAARCFDRINPDRDYCDASVETLLAEAEAFGRETPDESAAAWNMRRLLSRVDLRELPAIRHRLNVTPGADHAYPGPEWQPFSALPEDADWDRPHMAVIARDDTTASEVIRLYERRGDLVSEVPNDHRPSEQLVEAIERHFGEGSLARSEDARDFVETVVRSAFKDRLVSLVVPEEPLILSMPWRPHDTDFSLFLAKARRLRIQVIVRVVPAHYSGTAGRELERVLNSCGTLVLGPNTVLPDFVPGPTVANRSELPIFRPNQIID